MRGVRCEREGSGANVRVATTQYQHETGWSDALPRHLDSPQTLVLVFFAPSYGDDAQPLADLREAFPTAKIVGCSTAGEICRTTIKDDSVVVAVARFERTELRTAMEPIAAATSFEAGVRAGQTLLGDKLRGAFVLSTADGVNGSQLALGMRSVLGDTPISGALAADGTRFQRTWTIGEGHRREGHVVAVGFYGDSVRLAHGTKGGWDKFGPERRVTRSKDNVLYELDGRPALDLYKGYLGDLAAGMPATALFYPLAIRRDRSSTDQVVRAVLAHSDVDHSLTFAGDMPEGSLAQLMRANFDRLVLAAADAATDASRSAQRADLCIAVSCVARRVVLGDRSEEETEAVADAVPAGCPIVGFYSYGELSPFGALSCALHNQTMTLTMLEEEGEGS